MQVMTQQAPTASNRNAAIDVLRGYAAIAVLIFHAREILWVGISDWLHTGEIKWANPDVLLGFASLPFRYGWWGVPLFFVISGYCIHRPEVRRRGSDPNTALNLGKYAAKRAWRIYPVLVVSLLLTAALDHLTRSAGAARGDCSLSCFVINLAALENILGPTFGSNYALWTLAIEIHFYIVYPLYFSSLRVCGVLRSTAIVLAISAGSWYWLEWINSSVVVFLPYWFSWVVGAYIAEAEAGIVKFPSRTLLALSVPCLVAGLSVDRWKSLCVSSSAVVYTFLAIPFALLVRYAITCPGNWVWSNRVSHAAGRVGLFSYSLYATHVAVLYAYRALAQGGGLFCGNSRNGRRAQCRLSGLLACRALDFDSSRTTDAAFARAGAGRRSRRFTLSRH